MRSHAPGHAALRQGRHTAPGQAYLLTFVVDRRRPLFADFWIAHAAVTGMLHPPIWRNAVLWCWVLMPDHAHLLVQLGQDDASLDQLVQSCKAVARRNAARAGVRGPLWERAFHDRALRRDQDLRAVARYVIANPVRAGLVEHPGDYPFWDAAWLHHAPESLL